MQRAVPMLEEVVAAFQVRLGEAVAAMRSAQKPTAFVAGAPQPAWPWAGCDTGFGSSHPTREIARRYRGAVVGYCSTRDPHPKNPAD